jgi:hypothetical protein
MSEPCSTHEESVQTISSKALTNDLTDFIRSACEWEDNIKMNII